MLLHALAKPSGMLARECMAAIAQLGERQTEDLQVPGSILDLGNYYCC